jgi:cytochrome c553
MRVMFSWLLIAGILSLIHEARVPSASAATEVPAPDMLSQIWAATPDADHGRVLYLLHCRGCHGNHAWGDGPRAIPTLAGQREKYLAVQLTQFAAGRRAGQSMHETMQRPDLNRAQAVRDLVAYLTADPPNPSPDYGSSGTSAGERVYQEVCRNCHGVRGEGNDKGVPAIGGQHYRYLVAQLQNFSYGHRGAGDLRLLEPMGGLTPRAAEDVASYVSRLSIVGTR